MFTNATIYRISGAVPPADAIHAAAGCERFQPTLPTQQRSIGWVAPRPDGSVFAETVAGQIIMAAQLEMRAVPSDAIAKRLDAACEAIERETGRKPGAKHRRELKAQALLELLPQAFPKTVRVPVWIDPAAGLMLVGTTIASQADEIVTLVVRSLGMAVAPLVTNRAAAVVMSAWLLDGDADNGFALGAEAALQALDDTGEAVRYTNAELDADEVKDHIRHGKTVKALGLYYLDRAEIVLTDSLLVKKIRLTVPVADSATAAADAFDADVALHTGELTPMLSALIEALGGIVAEDGEADGGAS